MNDVYTLTISILCFCMMSCNTPDALTEQMPACHKTTASIESTEAWEPGDMSLYNLSSSWATQNNDSIHLGKLQGKIQLVALMYTSCTYACPRILHDLKSIDEHLTAEEKKVVNIVLVTLDPERDTPENLKSFAQKFRLDPQRWNLLTSTESNIRELSGLLNVKYRQETSLEISHSNIISLLDYNGELVHQKEGLGIDPADTLHEIRKLIAKRI